MIIILSTLGEEVSRRLLYRFILQNNSDYYILVKELY